MAYIGKQPVVGNFQVCDAISVVNGQAAYTMQVGGSNVEPENANHMLVSLNGILQKPGSSFTISGATITFASNLATGDVIDFITLLGDTLNTGTPSDTAVKAASLNNDVISGQTALTAEPDDTDEFLVSDAGTIKRIDYSLIKGAYNLISTTSASSDSLVTLSGLDSTYSNYVVVFSNVHPSSDDVQLFLRTTSGGSVNTGTEYTYASHAYRSNGEEVAAASTGATVAILNSVSTGNANNESCMGTLYIANPSETTLYKLFNGIVTTLDNSGRSASANTAGQWVGTAAVTAVSFGFTNGNIDSGIFKLYGIS